MNTVFDRQCRRWLSAVGGLFAAMLALVLTTTTASAQPNDSTQSCISIVEQKIECQQNAGSPTNTYQWCFTFVNRSNKNINSVSVGSSPVSVGLVQPGGRGHACVFLRGNPGTVVVTLEACSRDSVFVQDPGRNGGSAGGTWTVNEDCCQQRIELNLPECGQTSDCFKILQQTIECNRDANGAGSYIWCFSFLNQSDHSISSVTVGNSRVSVGNVPPGGTGHACVTVYGSASSNPLVVNVLMCGEDSVDVPDSGRDGNNNGGGVIGVRENCCDQRVELKLPDCPNDDGCIDIVEQSIECLREGANTQGAYEWCFVFVNHSNHPINTITVENNTYNVGPVPPGGRERVCVQIYGVPGPKTVGVLACLRNSAGGGGFVDSNNVRDICCDIRVQLKLPDCTPVERNCCDGFNIGIASLAPVAAPNGLTGLLGAISAGPNNIVRASATIVSSSINGQPAYGYFNSGVILNPMGAGNVTPPPFGEELVWTAPTAPGVPMSAPSLSLEWMRFPPMAPNARHDTLHFCIRWRFTDTQCRTCDTMVCYRVVRDRTLTGLVSTERKGSSIQGAQGIGGELDGQNSGRLSITLPALPESTFGTVTYTGITLQADDNVVIGNVDGGSSSFTTEHGLAIAEINAEAGEQINLNINYDNLGGRTSLGHFVLLGYESSNAPGVQQQIPLSVTLRQAGIELGGDNVEAVVPEIEGQQVETFALHLQNSNTTSEELSGLRIVAGEGVKILAVGPTSSENEALLRFGAPGEDGRAYVSEASEGTVQLAPGADRKPIYLTVSYDGELAPVISFETLNGLDETITEGTLDLAQVSSVHNVGGVTGSSVLLSDSRPNPTNGQTSISLNLANSEEVQLVLRDARGREVMRLLDGETLEKGTHVVNFNVSDLASGVYFYTVETPTGTETRKLTVQK